MTAQAKKLNSADKKALPQHIYDTFIVGAGISGIATAIRLDQVGYKENLLNKVKVIYGNQSSNSLQHRFLSLHIEENKFLTNHKILIENIKNIHKKLSGHENLLDNENIDKINKILGDTLPVTIHKYNQIDPNFRENIKNTEGKNAHQLFEESLTNILFTMKEVEFNLEQAKVNDLSLTNRKNRIK